MKLLILFAVTLLSACGFQPVYGIHKNSSGNSTAAQLENIKIDVIPEYEGQYLRNLLIDKFHRSGTAQNTDYILKVDPVGETQTELDITKTATATRTQMRLNTRIQLIDTRTGKPYPVLTRSVHAITSYNILSSEFSTRVTEQHARENALKDLARQIETQITLFFNSTS